MLDMTKVTKSVRKKNPFILILYGALVYLCSCSSRTASRVLSFMVRKSHTSILSWFRLLSFLFIDKSLRGKVKLLLIDGTMSEGILE
jgi:hypothetical protein